MDVKQIRCGPEPRRFAIDPRPVEQIFEETGAWTSQVQVRTLMWDGTEAWYMVERGTQDCFETCEPMAGIATWPVEASN